MGSSHISAQYGVPCEKCGAKFDEPCRTTTTGRVTDTHTARRAAYGAKRMSVWLAAEFANAERATDQYEAEAARHPLRNA